MPNKDLFLGIDPSLTGTGLIFLDNTNNIVKEELIKSKPRGKEPVPELERILSIIRAVFDNDFQNVIGVCLEGPAFMSRNTSSLVQLGYLNYRIREELYNRQIPFTIVPPTSLKKFACGKGNAKKDLVLLSVYKEWDVYFEDDNLADAYVLARMAKCIATKEEVTKVKQDVLNKLIK